MDKTLITTEQVLRKHAKIVARYVYELIDELAEGKGPNMETVLANTKTVLGNDKVFGLLAYHNAMPIGLIMLNECAAIYAGGIFGEISELYVSPELRSQGIAGTLIERAVTLGSTRGWKRLEVGAPNQPNWKRTFDFYVRSGFEEVGPRLRRIL